MCPGEHTGIIHECFFSVIQRRRAWHHRESWLRSGVLSSTDRVTEMAVYSFPSHLRTLCRPETRGCTFCNQPSWVSSIFEFHSLRSHSRRVARLSTWTDAIKPVSISASTRLACEVTQTSLFPSSSSCNASRFARFTINNWSINNYYGANWKDGEEDKREEKFLANRNSSWSIPKEKRN